MKLVSNIMKLLTAITVSTFPIMFFILYVASPVYAQPNGWIIRTSFPKTECGCGVGNGASMAYNSEINSIYALRGGVYTDHSDTRHFYKYDIASDTWTRMADLPAYQYSFADSLVWDREDYLYDSQGGFGTGLYRYTISSNEWSEKISDGVLETHDTQYGFIYGGPDTLYATFFYHEPGSIWTPPFEFAKYTPSTNSWTGLPIFLPRYTSALFIVKAGNYIYAKPYINNEFWRYDISSDNWVQVSTIPGSDANYVALVAAGDFIYLLKKGTKEFWRYDIASESWQELPNTPEIVGKASIVYDSQDNKLFALRGVIQVSYEHTCCDYPADAPADFWEFDLKTLYDRDVELPAGWSLVSLPVRPAIPTVANVFPQAVVVYRYQKGAGYVRVPPEEELEVGIGYWILFDNPQSYVMAGTEITEYTISVEDGWYLIGGCSSPAQKMVTSGKIDVIYYYTPGKGYELLPESEPLEPGKGYWILFSNTSEGAEFTARTLRSSPVAKTGQITSYAAGDDGDLQKGVAWPDPRFADHEDDTVTDNLTGLMWTQDANMYGQRTWADALSDCASCRAGGYSDWRLPNVRELHSLIDYGQYGPALPVGHPFTNVQSSYYWSSSTGTDNTGSAWGVNFNVGYVGHYDKDVGAYVWCVRGGR